MGADGARPKMPVAAALDLHEHHASHATRRRADKPEAFPPSHDRPTRARIVELDADGRSISVGAIMPREDARSADRHSGGDLGDLADSLGPLRSGSDPSGSRRYHGVSGDVPAHEVSPRGHFGEPKRSPMPDTD